MTRAAPSETRAQVRRVALELFSAQGYAGTSLREVADRMGFSKAALYYHYASKEELARDLLEPLLDAVDVVLQEPVRPTAAGRRLLVEAYARMILEHRALVRFAFSDLSVLAHAGLGPRVAAQGARLVEALGQADAGLEGELRAAFAFSGLQLALSAVEVDPDDAERAVRVVTEAALSALRPSRERPPAG